MQKESETINAFIGTSIASVEKLLILATIQWRGGNKVKAAKDLGISLKTVYNKLRNYGM